MPNIDNANRLLTRKIILIWGIANILFFISLADIWITNFIAEQISTYLPLIKSQLEKNTRIGFVAGRFFGLAALITPGAVLFLLWGDDLSRRATVGIARSGGAWKYFFTVSLLGIPFCIFILGFFYFAPIEGPQNPRLMGQIVIHAMVSTYWGLFVFGAIGIVAVALLLFMLFCFLSLPVLFIFRNTRN